MKQISDIKIDNDAQDDSGGLMEGLSRLDDFGLWQLSLPDAAELIAIDMLYAGKIDIEDPEEWDGNPFNPKIMQAWSGTASDFEIRLAKAVELGRLNATLAMRDFDENLIPDMTFVRVGSLENWLDERGYNVDEAFTEWRDRENDIANDMLSELIWLRHVKVYSRNPKIFGGYESNLTLADESNSLEVLSAYRAAVQENQHLRERLAQAETRQSEKLNAQAPPRARRTLLTLIAALCDNNGINIERRGTAQRIKEMTEQLGAPVDDETIRKVLADIPDALETRMK